MLVSQILKTKANDSVVTAAPETRVSQAAEMLAEKRIGTLVISGDGKTPLGILSERDIVRELGRRGMSCLELSAEQIMTSKLITCTRDEKSDDVLQKMTNGRFRHMPVLQDNEMVGLISLGDVVKAQLSELSMEKDALESMIMGH